MRGSFSECGALPQEVGRQQTGFGWHTLGLPAKRRVIAFDCLQSADPRLEHAPLPKLLLLLLCETVHQVCHVLDYMQVCHCKYGAALHPGDLSYYSDASRLPFTVCDHSPRGTLTLLVTTCLPTCCTGLASGAVIRRRRACHTHHSRCSLPGPAALENAGLVALASRGWQAARPCT